MGLQPSRVLGRLTAVKLRWRWLVALTAVVSLGGCGVVEALDPGRERTLPELREHARAALARYDRAAAEAGGGRKFVPVGSLTELAGEFGAEGDDLKAAAMSGPLILATALPGAPAGSGSIRWADGTTRSVPVMSAEEALGMRRPQDCGDCGPVTITGARPVTMRVDTTAGPATVPAWEYTLKGTAVRVIHAAVGRSDMVTVVPPSWDPNAPPYGESIESATTRRNSTELTVSFTGARGPASEPCGEDHHAEAIESGNAVIVIHIIERRHLDGNETCTLIGYTRTETVTLAQPLGERAVLEGREGLPVAVTITN